jgi:putative spermidine/putrescine transport system ATP-binding protein
VPDLKLRGLVKRYGATTAVDGVDLDVQDRELITLLGPSGSGKTTILRMIAGFVEPTAGTIAVGGREIQADPPERRDIGMVFQSYALFPHMTVAKNVAFGLERRRVPASERRTRVEEALALVRLSGLGERYPRQLSGGQQQRVALARALVIRPSLLLLDEPLSNLDAKLRGEVRLEIRRLQQELGITTVLVTHDQDEALTVSDRVAVLRDGRLEQLAAPTELYHRPANRFVADFVGKTSFLPATRIDGAGGSGGAAGLPDGARFRLGSGEVVSGPPGPERATLAVRPEAIRLGRPPAGVAANVVSGVLDYRVFLGELTEIAVRLANGSRLLVRTSESDPAALADRAAVSVWWPPERTMVLPAGD